MRPQEQCHNFMKITWNRRNSGYLNQTHLNGTLHCFNCTETAPSAQWTSHTCLSPRHLFKRPHCWIVTELPTMMTKKASSKTSKSVPAKVKKASKLPLPSAKKQKLVKEGAMLTSKKTKPAKKSPSKSLEVTVPPLPAGSAPGTGEVERKIHLLW